MSGTIYPQEFQWNGTALVPLNGRMADRQYVIGEQYRLAIHEDRSSASHNHYFAAVQEAWKNLPESEANKFPSSEHLRKRALVQAGYFDEEIIDCGTSRVAHKVGAAIRKHDDFAIIFIRDQFVIVRTAKSQSAHAMGKKDFQESKDKVMGILAELIGVKPDDLRENAGKAA